MAKLPIEILRIGNTFQNEIAETIILLNSSQNEIEFSLLSAADEEKFQLLNYQDTDCDKLLSEINTIRSQIKGYHPYLICITNSHLKGGKYKNLFGNNDNDKGLAIFTFNNVPDIIIPTNKIKSYIAYFIAKYTFNFLIPDHGNHEDTRGCAFDFKKLKTDIIKSMKAGALCDECRSVVNNPKYSISASQFMSINLLFSKTEELYRDDNTTTIIKSRIFIGSSIEGIDTARKIQNDLSNNFEVIIWNQGVFDTLGLSFLEILEDTVNKYDYGIFVFTPDDTITSRGDTRKIARDNVIFELGMFVGKLTRRKAFIVYPKDSDMHILSDFSGITMATYDPKSSNIQAALGPVCDRIRTSIG